MDKPGPARPYHDVDAGATFRVLGLGGIVSELRVEGFRGWSKGKQHGNGMQTGVIWEFITFRVCSEEGFGYLNQL